jgi:hypothetical protein
VKAGLQALAGKAIDVLSAALDSDDWRVRVAAAGQILDRGYGKAPQTINAKVEAVNLAEAHLLALQELTSKGRAIVAASDGADAALELNGQTTTH